MGSIGAVLFGTFTLRFSTGLTGAMLAFYLATLPEFGGVAVSGTTAGILTATYFAAELLLSPLFGILSDRVGAHRVMQIGPVLGAIAVAITAAPTNLWVLGGTRWLEGMAAAASVPSILGYIAIATSGNVALRGRTVARFEAATVAGLGVGAVVAGPLFEQFGSAAFLLNAGVYGVSSVIYRYWVRPIGVDAAASASRRGPSDQLVGGCGRPHSASPITGTSSGRAASGCSHRRGSRSTRSSARGRRRPSSSSCARTRTRRSTISC